MKRFIVIIVMIAVIAVVAVPRVMDNMNKQNNPVVVERYSTVGAEATKRSDIEDYTYLVGTIQAGKVAYVIPTMPAEVKNIYFEVGDSVKEEDILFELDGESVENQVELAQIAVDTALTSIDQANLGVSSAGDSVKMAELSYELAKANYDSGMEQYTFAKDNLEKYQSLYEEGIVSEAEYEQMKLQASENTVTLLEKQLEQAKESVEQAKSAVSNAGFSKKQAVSGYDQAKINYDQAVDSLEDMNYKASIDGVITAVNIDEGLFATNTEAAMVIEALDTVEVNINVSERIINKISKGQKVEIYIEAIGEAAVEGVIKSVSPSADLRSLLYGVSIAIDNKDHAIKPGMFANVKLVVNKAENNIVIKSNAVLEIDNQQFVYIVNGEKAKLVPVELGIDTGDLVEVVTGLNDGDIYLTKGMEFITESTKIKVIRGDE